MVFEQVDRRKDGSVKERPCAEPLMSARHGFGMSSRKRGLLRFRLRGPQTKSLEAIENGSNEALRGLSHVGKIK